MLSIQFFSVKGSMSVDELEISPAVFLKLKFMNIGQTDHLGSKNLPAALLLMYFLKVIRIISLKFMGSENVLIGIMVYFLTQNFIL